MKILAIDSSGLVASVAVAEDDVLLAEFTVNYKKTHSQTLLPMLENVRDMIELDMETVDAVAVAAGPGSFTGLRIGSATAKGLALALKKPIIPVPTLEGLAYNLYGTQKLVCPIMDARRAQVYTGVYEFIEQQNGLSMVTRMEQCALDIEDLIRQLNQMNREVIFLGDGVPVFLEKLRQEMAVPYLFAPAHMNRQRAAGVAALAKVLYEQGRFENAEDHVPVYLRLSQAERERLEQENGAKGNS